MSKERIRWGLMGSGRIIDRWIKGAKQVDDMDIVAIASRKPESAQIVCGETTVRLESPVKQHVCRVVDEGYQYEIRHVQECLRQGLTQSPLVTHAMTHDVLKMCDEIRRQWGLVYPFEQQVAPS
jgi:predicted dehydrogenase